MSGKGILDAQTSPIVDLEELYETTVEELQKLLGDPDYHRWSLEDETRIDDWLNQLCVWGSDLDIESGTLQMLREKEAAVVRSNLDLVRSSITVVESRISLEPEPRSAKSALHRLGVNVQNLCELSNSLQIAIDLDQRTSSVFKVKEHMESLSRKFAPPQPSNLKDVEREGSRAHTPLDSGTQNPETGYSSDLLSILQRCRRLSANGDPFWPDGLLKRILTRERVLESLDSHAHESVDTIVLPEEVNPGLSGRGLIKIYALLILLGKNDQILAFIEEGLLDKDIPLRYDGIDFFRGEAALRCFQGWLPSERSLFDSQQWGVAVPSLRLAPNGFPRHYDLDSRTIIPWAYDSANYILEIAGDNEGEVSEVHRIAIDPDSQALWEPLQEMGLDDTFFALRTLSTEHGDKDTFSKELDQLRMLSDTRYQHVVTLLASISYNGDYYFLFPYAECDLLKFWKDLHPEPPPQYLRETRWLIRQLSGLVGAMGIIHNQRGYHGDICPQQIHCVRSNRDPRGVMVLSSYGIPSPNRPKSHFGSVSHRYWRLRDNFQGDTLSRTYDLWSLGYVFLEFVTWFLGGRTLLDQFESRQRISQPPDSSAMPSASGGYTTGTHTRTVNILESGKPTNRGWPSAGNASPSSIDVGLSPNPGVMREQSLPTDVNREAIEWVEQLRHHQNRDRFIEDILSIIEKRMLSVVMADADKIYSFKLQWKLARLYRQCGGYISGLESIRRKAPLASAKSRALS